MPMPRLTDPAHRSAVGVAGSALLTACQPGTPSRPGLTPQQRLMALAAGIGGSPDDDTAQLPYTYLHTQTWARSTDAITRTDLRRWRRKADCSGQEAVRHLPDLPGVDHQPRSQERHLLARSPKTTTRHAAGSLRPHLPEPLPADPAVLIGQLVSRGLVAEPTNSRTLAGGVIGLAVSQYLNRDQRATCLRALADLPGITYGGEARDVAGRLGLAFTVIADGSTTTLVVDARTGELLAAEERVSGNRPGLLSYVLILERGHTARPGAAIRP
ncbi:hypothetical protein [Micromonospora arborensis]|uniref:hypothetical protein n=1 Tax=Micromonospora arborensis TaxID=2116518 RepID=UPI00371B31FD